MTRGRRPNLEPSALLNLSLPETYRDRLELILHSTAEGRVPKGAYRQLFVSLLDIFFESRPFDLSPYVGSLPGDFVVRGKPAALAALEAALKQGK